MTTPTDWFVTTPEATLRAESILTAFHEDRLEDIAATLTTDYTAEDANPLQTVVALVAMCDRLADHVARIEAVEHVGALREVARVVATAYYDNNEKGHEND